MNNCILMAEIIQAPQLRYTPDNQIPVADMLVQFAGLREEDPPATLKVVGWGNLAKEIQERCHQGDRVVIEGRLSMNTIERPEGFKEKRAELTAQRIHYLDGSAPLATAAKVSNTTSDERLRTASDYEDTTRSTPSRTSSSNPRPASEPAPQPKMAPISTAPRPVNDADVDDIPF